MNTQKILKTSFLLALGEIIYISLVALFFTGLARVFGGQSDPPEPFGFIIFLTLFVISAAVSGALILGKPILMYLEGQKKEGLKLFFATIGWLIIFVILFIVALFYFN